MFDLDGCRILITGATGAIGASIVERLASAGADVVGADRIVKDAVRRLDVTDEGSWKILVEALGREIPYLDVLVNCAGVAPMGKIEEMQLSEWRKTMAVNVEGVALGLKICLPLLRASAGRRQGGASVINIASAAANRASAFSAAYCSSKAAVAMLTKVAAVEFSQLGYGVRVNSVHPGVVRSAMMDEILGQYSSDTGLDADALSANILERYTIKRFAEPEEVAAAVHYLASAEAAYLNGVEQHVDGGYLGA